MRQTKTDQPERMDNRARLPETLDRRWEELGKSSPPKATSLRVVASADRSEIVTAPAYLEVFARMAFGVQKILPCE
jgi:hypothetical protein